MSARPAPALLRPLFVFLGAQLGHPRGWFGRFVTTRALNRSNRAFVAACLARLPIGPETRLLDVGFGGGIGLALARERGAMQLLGVDVSIDAVTAVRQSSKAWARGAVVDLRVGSMLALPLDDASVDAVLTTNTVYFLDDVRPAFVELHRVLVAGGVLALGFASEARLRSLGPITAQGFRFHTESTLVSAARDAGFTDVRVEPVAGEANREAFVLVAVRA